MKCMLFAVKNAIENLTINFFDLWTARFHSFAQVQNSQHVKILEIFCQEDMEEAILVGISLTKQCFWSN